VRKWWNPNFNPLEDFDTYQVQVQILEIEWLSENLHQFFEYLADLKPEVFGNELIRVLLEQ
jgi:hypothetical protein